MPPAPAPAPTPGPADVTVNSSIKFQTIEGWETMGRAWEINKSTNKFDSTVIGNKDIIADRLVNDVGINRFMINIQSGFMNPVDYWTQFVNGQLSYTQWGQHMYESVQTTPQVYQYSEFDFYVENMLLPLKSRVEAKGEKFYVCVSVGDFGGGAATNLELSANPSAYADFVLHYFNRLKNKYGIVPDALNLINEPENTGTPVRWTGQKVGEALVAVQARLSGAGYNNINYIGPSVTNAANAIPWITSLTSVPGALSKLTTLSYHRYGLTNFIALKNFADANSLRTTMNEYYPANHLALIEDLTVVSVTSWQKWGSAARTGGSNSGYLLADFSNSLTNPTITLSPQVAIMSAIFKYVRIGAKRVEVTSGTTGRVALGFENSNGKQVLVIRSSGLGAPTVKIAGLKPGSYGVRLVNFSEVISSQSDVTVAPDGTVSVSVGDGVTTIFGK